MKQALKKLFRRIRSQGDVDDSVSYPPLILRNTVICQLSSGLANQMISYKAGRYLSHAHGMGLLLDATSYSSDSGVGNRNLQLHFHQIQHNGIVHHPALLRSIFTHNQVLRFPDERATQFFLPEVQQEASVWAAASIGDNLVVNLWLGLCLRKQADLYFREQSLNDELRIDETRHFSDSCRNFLRLINSSRNSVALHVRRGDFATHDGGMLVSNDLYNAAIQLLERDLELPSFFVFSDDIEWCRVHLRSKHKMHFADFNDERHGYRDLALGSRCSHFILSNESTYSHMMLELAQHQPGCIVLRTSRNGSIKRETF